MSRRGVGITGHPLDQKEDEHSVRAYCIENIDVLEDYVMETFPDESEVGHLKDLLANPYVARTVIENYETPNAEKFHRIIDYYCALDSCLTVTIGRKRHWKTITTTDIVYEIHKRTSREVYAPGLQDAGLPWIHYVPTLQEVPERAIVLQDEAGVEAGARTSNTSEQRDLPAQLATEGHNKWLHFVIVQNTSIMDKSFLALADCYLLKPTSIAQLQTERGALKPTLRTWKELLPRRKWESLFLSSDMNPWTFTRPIPDWWDQSLSYAYKQIETEGEAMEAASRLREVGKAWSFVARRLRIRGWALSDEQWRRKILEANDGEDPKFTGTAGPVRRVIA